MKKHLSIFILALLIVISSIGVGTTAHASSYLVQGANLLLGSALGVQYVTEVPFDMNLRGYFECNGRTKTATPMNAGGYCAYTYNEVMPNEFEVPIKLTVNGKSESHTLKEIAILMLNGNYDDEVYEVVSDMLRYCKAAYDYMPVAGAQGTLTGSLGAHFVDKELQSAPESDKALSARTNDSVYISGFTYYFSNYNRFCVMLHIDDSVDLSQVTLSMGGMKYTRNAIEPYKGNDGVLVPQQYVVFSRALPAQKVSYPISGSLSYQGNELQQYTYSTQAYSNSLGSRATASSAAKNLAYSLCYFGDSTVQYAKKAGIAINPEEPDHPVVLPYAVISEDGTMDFVGRTEAPVVGQSFTSHKGETVIKRVYQLQDNQAPWHPDIVSAYNLVQSIYIATEIKEIWHPTNLSEAFANHQSCTEIIGLQNLDTSNTTNMSKMFRGCRALTSLDMFGFNTSNTINMSAMFAECSNLTILDLSGFNTINVTNMSSMFGGCENLTTLNISGFNTINVTDMSSMFCNAKKLSAIEASVLKTSNVTNMSSMFAGCQNLSTLDVSGFDTSKVTNMNQMFGGCQKLTHLDVSGFNTLQVTDMGRMFNSCKALTALDVSGFKTQNVTSMEQMFMSCEKFTSPDVSGFNTTNVTKMGCMFYGCTKINNLNVSGFNTAKVTDMSGMFGNCSSLTTLDVSGFNTLNVTNMTQMFMNCSALSTLDVSDFKTPNVTDMGSMFSGCENLTVLDVSGFDTSKVTGMHGMFYNCRKITTLDVSGFETSKVEHMNSMFAMCTNLTALDLSNFNTSKVYEIGHMFWGCSSLTTLDASTLYAPNATSMSYMFNGCTNLTTLDISNLCTSKVTDMSNMFSECRALTSLDISSFDTSKTTDMMNMFNNCQSLATIYVSDLFKTNKVQYSSNMFYNCLALKGGNGTPYNSSNVHAAYAHVDTPEDPGYFTAK